MKNFDVAFNGKKLETFEGLLYPGLGYFERKCLAKIRGSYIPLGLKIVEIQYFEMNVSLTPTNLPFL